MTRYPMPDLLTVGELQGILRMGYRSCLRWIDENLKEIPGAVHLASGRGSRFLINAWALARVLHMEHNCPGCGRPWPEHHEQPDRSTIPAR